MSIDGCVVSMWTGLTVIVLSNWTYAVASRRYRREFADMQHQLRMRWLAAERHRVQLWLRLGKYEDVEPLPPITDPEESLKKGH